MINKKNHLNINQGVKRDVYFNKYNFIILI